MKRNILFMLDVISAVVTGGKLPPLEENISWELIYSIAKNHSVANIVAYAAVSGEYDVTPEVKAMYEKDLFQRVLVSENQNAELLKVTKAFDEENIAYMPLKGVILKELYKSSDMRYMVDADVLVKTSDFEKISKIMADLGYTYKGESDHEYNFIKKPFIHIELHKHLIPSYNDDMYSYFGDGWTRAEKVGNSCRYELGCEDNFIYILAHFAKHYRDGGIGIRHLVDIWLYERQNEMDREYLYENLDSLNLLEFYRNLQKLMKAWFEKGEFDSISRAMTEFIINSGMFGTKENSMTAAAIRDSDELFFAARFKYIKALFPKLDMMKKVFPILERVPFLLPVMWLWRIVRLVIFRRDKISDHKQNVASIKEDSINIYSRHMEAVGLDIYNGRRKQ